MREERSNVVNIVMLAGQMQRGPVRASTSIDICPSANKEANQVRNIGNWDFR